MHIQAHFHMHYYTREIERANARQTTNDARHTGNKTLCRSAAAIDAGSYCLFAVAAAAAAATGINCLSLAVSNRSSPRCSPFLCFSCQLAPPALRMTGAVTGRHTERAYTRIPVFIEL